MSDHIGNTGQEYREATSREKEYYDRKIKTLMLTVTNAITCLEENKPILAYNLLKGIISL